MYNLWIERNDDNVYLSDKSKPVLCDLTYDRVKITGRSLDEAWTDCRAIELIGFDDDAHAIRNVVMKDIEITGGTGVYTKHCVEAYCNGSAI